MYELNNNLSKITDIPEPLLSRLSRLEAACMVDAVLPGKSSTEINVGYGVITIEIHGEEIRYKFKPTPMFEQMMIRALESGNSPAVAFSTKTLYTKLKELYGMYE